MQALYEILDNKKLRTDYTHALVDSCVSLKDGVFQWSAGKVCRQYAFSLAERNTCFNWSFDKLSRMSGFETSAARFFDGGLETGKLIKTGKYLEQQREIKVISDILDFQKIKAVTKEELNEIKMRIKTQKETAYELQQDRVLTAYYKYESSFRPQLTWSDIIATNEKGHLLDNAWLFATKTPDQWQSHDLKKLQYAAMPEKLAMRRLRFESICRLLHALKLYDAKGSWQHINKRVFEDNEPLILEQTRLFAKLDDRTWEKSTPVGALKKELKYCGFDLEKKRLRTGEIETKGKSAGQKKKEAWYCLCRLEKLKTITLLKPPGEKGKPEKLIVSLQRLLPAYKREVMQELKPLEDSDDEWGDEPADVTVSMLKAIVSMANSSAAAAKASAECASAASSLATISLSMFDRKRGLGKGVGINDSKKQRI